MSSHSKGQWITLTVIKIGKAEQPNIFNTNHIIYADEWMLGNGRICKESIRVFVYGHPAPIRVKFTLDELSRHPAFIMVNRALYSNKGNDEIPNWVFQRTIKQVLCKNSILNIRQYEDDELTEHIGLIQHRWYLYMQGNNKILSFEVRDDMAKLLPESIL